MPFLSYMIALFVGLSVLASALVFFDFLGESSTVPTVASVRQSRTPSHPCPVVSDEPSRPVAFYKPFTTGGSLEDFPLNGQE